MEDLTSTVGGIETALHGSRRQLQTLEKIAQASITQEVDGMRKALLNGDGKIEHVFSEIQSFLRRIEYNNTVETIIDLKPQMTWLSTNLDEIVTELKKAESRAETAMFCTNDYTYKVMDVGQEVEISRSKLTEAHRRGELLTSEAQSELSNSESLLATTESKIVSKERDIRTKTNESKTKRERKLELDSEISTKNQEISRASRVRESKKDKAAIGAGLGFVGIILAPVTFGASLGLAAVGAGMAGQAHPSQTQCRQLTRISVNAVEASDLKDQISAANASVSRLQSDIAQGDRDISALEQQKHELQRLVVQYQSDVDTRKAKHREFAIRFGKQIESKAKSRCSRMTHPRRIRVLQKSTASSNKSSRNWIHAVRYLSGGLWIFKLLMGI
ncbi:hypothetical protein MMC11_004637 [Xylographa trunciseda]|nr:hypothetical protein [Xylographa trunciseda]